MSELMGSETPVGHISSQHRETWKPLGERLIAMRNAGEDCKDVDLTGLGSRRYKAGQEVLSMFSRHPLHISIQHLTHLFIFLMSFWLSLISH